MSDELQVLAADTSSPVATPVVQIEVVTDASTMPIVLEAATIEVVVVENSLAVQRDVPTISVVSVGEVGPRGLAGADGAPFAFTASPRLMGRVTAGPGAGEEVSIGSSLSITAATINTIQDIRTSASPSFAGLTVSGLTMGSVPFAGVGGVLSQDNSKLYWDNTAKALGLGTTTFGDASTRLEVHGGSPYPVVITNETGAAYTQMNTFRNSAFGGGIEINHARGTKSVPLPLNANDIAGTIYFQGRNLNGENVIVNNIQSIQIDKVSGHTIGRFLIGAGKDGIPLMAFQSESGVDAWQVAAFGNQAHLLLGDHTFNLAGSGGATISHRLVNAEQTTVCDTTGGAFTMYSGYFSNTSLRNAGGAALTNVGVYGKASGAQVNYSALLEGSDALINTLTVGLGAGQVSTNTAAGVSALAAATTGALNVAAGYEALKVNTSGAQNTAVGYRALKANITSSNNTAVGTQALLNSTGSANTAVGASSAQALTTGSSNVTVGSEAGLLLTTGSTNTLIGTGAGAALTTAGDNTFAGYNALVATTGGQNTGIGSLAGATNVTGAHNTLIGYAADVVATNLTYATAVGASAIVNSSSTIVLGRTSDVVVIGATAKGLARNLQINTPSTDGDCNVFIQQSGSGNTTALRVQQTAGFTVTDVFRVEGSSGQRYFSIDSAGAFTAVGACSITGGGTLSVASGGAPAYFQFQHVGVSGKIYQTQSDSTGSFVVYDATASAPRITVTTSANILVNAATETASGGLIQLPTGTTAASGILAGTDTNLYRSAANTWKTDDSLTVAGGTLTIGTSGILVGGASLIEQKDAANAQTFRVYGNTTGAKYAELKHDGTDAALDASSGVLKLGGTATLKFGTAMVVATLPAAFVADNYLAVRDSAGATRYIPAASAAW